MQELIKDQNVFFKSQQTKSISFRLDKLKKLRNEIIKRENDITDAIYKDFKKSEFEVLSSEIGVVLSELNKTIKNLRKWSKPKNVLPAFVNFPSIAKIYKDSYGTVLIISPWNYPFNLAMIPIIGAIAGGNTVVLKPSELSENTSIIMEEVLKEVFKPQHLAVIQGGAKIAQSLLNEKWDYIFFTGSVSVGKIVYQSAAKNLTPVTLELGGKSPVIIDETANIKVAAKRIVWGKFLNAGQTCIAPDYILVDKKIESDLIEKLKKEIIIAYGENPKLSKDFPRIINKANFVRLSTMLEGEKIIFGGDLDESEKYISPTLVHNPSLDNMLMKEEIFGPILPIISYNTIKQVDDILKLHPNPLALYIFSTCNKIQKYFIEKYSFGGGTINDTLVHFVNDRLPYGGVGDSGIGAYHGRHSFNIFTRNKSIVKRYNWLDIPIRYLPSNKWKKKLINFFLTGRF